MQDKTRFKKRFPNKSPYIIPRMNKGKWSTPKLKEDKCSGPYVEKSIFDKCGRKHEGKWLVGMEN